MGIGHVRYPTKRKVILLNECQPFFKGLNYNISLVHNGQIWITDKLINYFKYYNIELPDK